MQSEQNRTQSKTVAIVGANSFLATSIIAVLKEHYTLQLYGRRLPAGMPVVNFTLFDHPSASLRHSDLLQFDVIVYTAGAGIQSNIATSSEDIYAVNCFLPISLFQYLQENSYNGHVITFGSYFEIGNCKEEKYYNEFDFVHHNNLVPNNYCIAKKLLTQYVYQKLPSIPFVLTHLVLPNIYGAGENAARIIPYLVTGIKSGTPLQLSSGTQQRQFLHVRDVANVVQQIIEQPVQGIYNLGSTEVLSIATLAQMVLDCVEGPKPELQLGSIVKKDTGMQFLALDFTKAKQDLHWAPTVNLAQGIKEYFDFNY